MAAAGRRPGTSAAALAPLVAGALAALALAGLAQTAWGPVMHHAGHAGVTTPALAAVGWMAGWSLMAVAMMLPAATPLITRAVGARGFLTVGLLGVWAAAGLAALLVALTFGRAGVAAGPLLLIAAGVYQLSPAKARALALCRSHARSPAAVGTDPTAEALRAGVHHGMLSLRCCAPLMVAASIAAPGGVGGMLALGALLASEEAAPAGARLRIPLGLIAVVLGAGALLA